TISWSGQVQGFSNREPIESLSLYATREWFTDAQQSHLLDMLRFEVLHAGRALMDEVCEIFTMEYIKCAWRERNKYDDPKLAHLYPRAKALGAVLASGDRERLAMMGNLQNLHWIAAVVNCKSSRILYGDPFKYAPDSETKKALQWWTTHHTGRVFAWGNLDVPNQRDGFNCGILAHNGLEHHLLPGTPLINGKGTGPGDARLEMLIKIINRHLDVRVDFFCGISFTYHHRHVINSTRRLKRYTHPSRPASTTWMGPLR
ncbi:hypothetical protein DFH06DRAFT_1020369, partial [Mycena polygramma]